MIHTDGKQTIANAPVLHPGQLTVTGGELVPVNGMLRRIYDVCCDKALREHPDACACHFTTLCPDHGRKHHGTHD